MAICALGMKPTNTTTPRHLHIGSAYLPAYAKGTRAGIEELGPALIGEDPTQLLKINQLMDQRMKGHPYGEPARPARRDGMALLHYAEDNANAPTVFACVCMCQRCAVKSAIDMACWDILGKKVRGRKVELLLSLDPPSLPCTSVAPLSMCASARL